MTFGLGRVVNHDPRSLDYAYGVLPYSAIGAVSWTRRSLILDQKSLGSCTGNAATGWLGTDRKGVTASGSVVVQVSVPGYFDAGLYTLGQAFAVKLYSLATHLDAIPGEYPPNDTGSSGIGVAKALVKLGLATTYQHAFSLAAVNSALQAGPVLIGIPWYNSCYTPDATGLIKVDAGSGTAGGHELLITAWDGSDRYRVANSWGTGWGIMGYGYLNTGGLTTLLADRGDVTVPNLATPVPPSPTPVPAASADATLWAAAKAWAKAKGLPAATPSATDVHRPLVIKPTYDPEIVAEVVGAPTSNSFPTHVQRHDGGWDTYPSVLGTPTPNDCPCDTAPPEPTSYVPGGIPDEHDACIIPACQWHDPHHKCGGCNS